MTSTTLEDWDGADGERWAAEAERYDRMTRRFADAIVNAVAARPGERLLDVGCGNGALTLALAEPVAPDGTITGLDISSPMLAVAERRARQRGLTNTSFLHADAQAADLEPGSFDAVVSRFGVMFFNDPVAAFTNLANALRPGGRLVFTCWRDLLANDWIMVPAAAALEHVPLPELGDEGGRGPFSFAEPDRVRSILDAAGFTDIDLRPLDLPVTLGTDVDDAIDFMRHGEMAQILFTDAEQEAVDRAWDAIRHVLTTADTGDVVDLNASAWLIHATSPGREPDPDPSS